MLKRISFIVLSFFLVAFSINFLQHKVLAVASSPTTITSTTTFSIRGGNGNDAYDANGKTILKPNQVQGHNVIILDASLNGRTAELPVGTLIFLHFPTGAHHFTINSGVVEDEATKGEVHLPQGDIGLLKVVGQGTATISVTERVRSGNRPITNAAHTASNWSGYERTTGGAYTDIISQWTVPTASSCSSGDTYSSAWLGIDGADGGSNLIQTGTESDCSSNSPFYRAWWEILPTYTVEQPLNTTTYPVSAGDNMFAEIKQNSGTNWTITIKNLTQNWASSSAQTYSGSGNTTEWILERPTLSGGILATLTNYGSTSFTNDTQNGANPNHTYSTDSINMLADDGVTVISTPSNPNSLNDAFAVAYGSTQPSAPASWSNNSPTGTGNDSIYSMAASSQTSVWAAGYERPSGYSQTPVTWLNTGSGWTKYLPTNLGSYTNHWLYGIAGSSSDAWTVGTYAPDHQHTLAYHWNGSSWSHVTSDDPSSTQGNVLYGVSIDGSGNVYAAGSYYDGTHFQPLIEKWNGTKFAQQTIQSLPSGYSGQLYGVSFSSSTNAWAVGGVQWYSGGLHYAHIIYHYDGSSWTYTIGSSTNSPSLNSITTSSDSEAWAVGSKYNGSSLPYIMHYTSANGWQEDTSFSSSFPSGTTLKSVSTDSSSDVWIVGYAGSAPYTMHYNGSSWVQVSTPSVSGTSILQGVAVNSGVAWAGGQNIPSGATNPNPLVFQSK